MATIIDKLARNANGQPILTGCEKLPPMEDAPEPPQTPNDSRRQSGKQKPKRTAGDRFAMLNAFIDGTMRELTPSERIVWIVLYRDTKDGLAKSSQAYVAERSGLTQSTVSQAIKRLTERGLVKVIRQGGFRKGLSVYKIRGSSCLIP